MFKNQNCKNLKSCKRNKQNKIVAPALTLVIILTVFMFLFTACGNVGEAGVKDVTVYIGDEAFSVTTEQLNVFELLNEMKSKNAISAAEYDSTHYLTKLHNLTPDPLSQFITVYHTISDITLQMPVWPSTSIEPVTHEGRNFYCSGVGVELLPVKDGEAYWFFIVSFA